MGRAIQAAKGMPAIKQPKVLLILADKVAVEQLYTLIDTGLTPLLNHLPSAITHGRIVLRDAEYFDAIPLPLVHLGATEFVCRTVDGERIRVTGSGAVVVFLNGEAAPGPVAH